MSLIKRLWNDEAGFIVSAELILIATIAVLGLIVALDTVRNAVTSELSDVAGAIQDVNQSYSYSRVTGHSSIVAGSNYIDNTDWCDTVDDTSSAADDNCIVHSGTVDQEGNGALTNLNP